jgi:DNA-directed RNA polymerase specialized sigma24 family protein
MLNDEQQAKALTQRFMVKLLLNIRKARASGDIRLWIYRNVIADVQNAITGDLQLKKFEFGELEKLIDHEIGQIADEAELQALSEKELELAKNTCLSGMVSCLPVEQRFAFILAGVLNVPVEAVAEILEIDTEKVTGDLSEDKSSINSFISKKCSLLGNDNSCTCNKRANYYREHGAPLDIFSGDETAVLKKLNELLTTQGDESDMGKDDLIKLYLNQPFLNTNSADRLLNMLKPKFNQN